MKFIELLFQVTVAILVVVIVVTEAVEEKGCDPRNKNEGCDVTEICYDVSKTGQFFACRVPKKLNDDCTSTDPCESKLACKSSKCVAATTPKGGQGKLGGAKNEEEGDRFPGILATLLNALQSVKNKLSYNRG